MDNQLEKVEGLYARIRSGYYLKNENNKILQFYNESQYLVGKVSQIIYMKRVTTFANNDTFVLPY